MFWERFMELCAQERLSPGGVCRTLGFSGAAATHWKHGAKPGESTLARISAFFGVTPEYFTSDKISTLPSSRGVRIPVYGRVAAGIPIEAITDIEDYEEITRSLASTGEFFALRIHGSSMEPKISDGDTVIVRRQECCENDDIVIVLLGDADATCKRFRRISDGIMLLSSNTLYEPMVYSARDVAEMPIAVLGKVVELRAKL